MTPGPFLIKHNDTEGIYLVNGDGTILCARVHTRDDASLIAALPDILTNYYVLLHLAETPGDFTPEERLAAIQDTSGLEIGG